MEESVILQEVEDLRDSISCSGHSYNNTRELIGATLSLYVSELDLDAELLSIRDYYGDKFLKRMEDEDFHYKQLKYGLLHKVKEIEFFHKEFLESRKIIIFSNDCISSVQYLKRGNKTKLMVHMRSSDVRNLLPLDLWALCDILKSINKEYCPGESLIELMSVTIGSAHYYLTGGRD